MTSTEMAWKSHWAWHLGTSGANTSSSGEGGTSAIERKLQSLSDRLAGHGGGQGGKRGNGRGGGRRGGKRFQPGNGNGGKKKGQNDGEGSFNKNIPPAPGQGGGKSAGRAAWAKRAKNSKGKGK